jgi:hypothetical protein
VHKALGIVRSCCYNFARSFHVCSACAPLCMIYVPRGELGCGGWVGEQRLCGDRGWAIHSEIEHHSNTLICCFMWQLWPSGSVQNTCTGSVKEVAH